MDFKGEITDKFIGVIKRNIEGGKRLGVAVSGGIDSVCLLSLILHSGLFDKSKITVLNVEHGIRGESSVKDSAFVRELAEKNGLTFIGKSVNVPELCIRSGRSEESEAREARRSFFSRLIGDGTVDYILTAHHLGDNTESVLMHIFRGCGIRGLIGMRERDGFFVRPLIGCTRSEIEAYALNNNLKYVTDETNSVTDYTRNFLRLEVLPKIRERYSPDTAVSVLSENARDDEAFISSFLDFKKYIRKEIGVVKLDFYVFSLAAALKNRYIFEAVRQAGRASDVDSKHVKAVSGLFEKENGKRIELGGGLVAAREYDCIAFFRADKKDCAGGPRSEEDGIPFAPGLTPFGDGIIEVLSVEPFIKKGRLIIDADRVPDGAVVRFRRERDIFAPFGSGVKKLKEYLIDRKIPLRIRDSLPLLCYNNKVLAVFGVEIADELKITASTVNALELKYTSDFPS